MEEGGDNSGRPDTLKINGAQTPRESALSSLKRLRDEYGNARPKEIVRFHDPENPVKVRKNWFAALTMGMDLAIRRGEVKDPELLEEIAAFKKDYTGEEFANRLTTDEDIAKANMIISQVVGDEQR